MQWVQAPPEKMPIVVRRVWMRYAIALRTIREQHPNLALDEVVDIVLALPTKIESNRYIFLVPLEEYITN